MSVTGLRGTPECAVRPHRPPDKGAGHSSPPTSASANAALSERAAPERHRVARDIWMRSALAQTPDEESDRAPPPENAR
eukprot:1732339-Pyramimonas_sp.AAC.1